MYLSRLVLNPRSRAVRRDLADCCGMHRTLMSAFPDIGGANGAARAKLGVLYRLEERHDRPNVLVQSQEQPEWDRLDSAYLLSQESKSVMEFCQALKSGRRLRFRLLANPTRKILTKTGPDGRSSNGRRVELRTESEWISWLNRKAHQHGFRIEAASTVAAAPDIRAVRRGKAMGGSGQSNSAPSRTFFGVQFDGRLLVVDRELFLAGLRNGIGPGKAYGFGLLSIATG